MPKIVIVDTDFENNDFEVDMATNAHVDIALFNEREPEAIIRNAQDADGVITSYGNFPAEVFDGTGTLNAVFGVVVTLGAAFGATDGFTLGGAGFGETFFFAGLGDVWAGFAEGFLTVFCATAGVLVGAFLPALEAGFGFCVFAGFGEGIDTLRLGSFTPPPREFLSARYLVFLLIGVASLSTRTNSISFIFGFGLSNINKFMPNKANAIATIQISTTTAGCNIIDITNAFLNDM